MLPGNVSRQFSKELQTRTCGRQISRNDAFAEFGIIGVLMRIQDKISRALSISKSGVNLVDDESIKDTLIDLHNYAAMGLMLA